MNLSTPLPPRADREGRKLPKKKIEQNCSANKRGIPKWLKITFISILFFFVAALFIIGYFAWYANYKLNDISTVANQEGGGTATVQNTLSPRKDPFSFILLGIDHRPKLPGRRTDVIMVGAVHPDTQEAVLVSLPRDTYFVMPGHHPDKLGHYYSKFSLLKKQGKLDSLSPEDEMKTMISKYMEIPINYAAIIGFKAFSDIVDAVDGIHVNVDQNMCYHDYGDGTHINLKKGPQTLDGKKALDFVRYRKSNCRPMTKAIIETKRNVRQAAVAKEIIGKVQSFGGLTKVMDIINAVANNIKIDMTPSQMYSLTAKYLHIKLANIHFISVDGEWRSPYIYPNKIKLEEGKQALKHILAGKSLFVIQHKTLQESRIK